MAIQKHTRSKCVGKCTWTLYSVLTAATTATTTTITRRRRPIYRVGRKYVNRMFCLWQLTNSIPGTHDRPLHRAHPGTSSVTGRSTGSVYIHNNAFSTPLSLTIARENVAETRIKRIIMCMPADDNLYCYIKM